MNHPNIVKLKEVIRENDILYFVFEYMVCDYQNGKSLLIILMHNCRYSKFCLLVPGVQPISTYERQGKTFLRS